MFPIRVSEKEKQVVVETSRGPVSWNLEFFIDLLDKDADHFYTMHGKGTTFKTYLPSDFSGVLCYWHEDEFYMDCRGKLPL